jgi:hypothetical protein
MRYKIFFLIWFFHYIRVHAAITKKKINLSIMDVKCAITCMLNGINYCENGHPQCVLMQAKLHARIPEGAEPFKKEHICSPHSEW